MDPVTALSLLALGTVVGVVSALLGVGGGVLMVPALDELLRAKGVGADVSQRIAVATSLVAMVPTSLAAGYRQYRADNVSVPALKMLAPGIVLGAVAGAIGGQSLRAVVLRAIFGGVLFAIGVKMLLGKGSGEEETGVDPAGPKLAALGAFTGVFSALTGLGGGVLMVPAMRGMGMRLHRAVGTSSAVIGVMAIGASVTYMLQPLAVNPDHLWLVGTTAPLLALVVASTAFFTTKLGVAINVGLKAEQLRRVFGASLMLIALRVGWVMLHG